MLLRATKTKMSSVVGHLAQVQTYLNNILVLENGNHRNLFHSIFAIVFPRVFDVSCFISSSFIPNLGNRDFFKPNTKKVNVGLFHCLP